MTPRGNQLLGAMRRNFELLADHDKLAPAEVDQIIAFAIAHLRSWRPQALLAMQADEVRRG